MKTSYHLIDLPYYGKTLANLTVEEKNEISIAVVNTFCEATGMEIKETITDETFGNSYYLGLIGDSNNLVWGGLSQVTSSSQGCFLFSLLSSESKLYNVSDKTQTAISSSYTQRMFGFSRPSNNNKICFKIFKDKNFILISNFYNITQTQSNIENYIDTNCKTINAMIYNIKEEKSFGLITNGTLYDARSYKGFNSVVVSFCAGSDKVSLLLGELKDGSNYLFSPYISYYGQEDVKINNLYCLYSKTILPQSCNYIYFDGIKYFVLSRYNSTTDYLSALIKVDKEE